MSVALLLFCSQGYQIFEYCHLSFHLSFWLGFSQFTACKTTNCEGFTSGPIPLMRSLFYKSREWESVIGYHILLDPVKNYSSGLVEMVKCRLLSQKYLLYCDLVLKLVSLAPFKLSKGLFR